mmetsp:Transcript_37062/g.84869  ORF Transcript_37062/g.84869 Transcript_37062/m.84869 type:complete len:113 (-) Transcript_37062:61-399(-)
MRTQLDAAAGASFALAMFRVPARGGAALLRRGGLSAAQHSPVRFFSAKGDPEQEFHAWRVRFFAPEKWYMKFFSKWGGLIFFVMVYGGSYYSSKQLEALSPDRSGKYKAIQG